MSCTVSVLKTGKLDLLQKELLHSCRERRKGQGERENSIPFTLPLIPTWWGFHLPPYPFPHFCKKSIEDPRIDRTKQYKLIDIMTIAICAVISGADIWVAIRCLSGT
ncbi:transposase family protein [Nostoc sp.]|uniref:transposase family protein n=1 Tax=Nostoc sp. TaxID=1180 RepID=UPI003FA600A8